MFEPQFAEPSQRFFSEVRQGLFDLVTSAVVQREIQWAPSRVVELFQEMLPLAEVARPSEKAMSLQSRYLEAGILTETYADDALHVATASAAGCDIIVSWNFRHIVHFRRIPLCNAVNRQNGCKEVGIYSPLELCGYEDKHS